MSAVVLRTTSENPCKGKTDDKSVAEETLSKPILSVRGDITTAIGMLKGVNLDNEDKGSAADLSITPAISLIVINEFKGDEDGLVKPTVHIDT